MAGYDPHATEQAHERRKPTRKTEPAKPKPLPKASAEVGQCRVGPEAKYTVAEGEHRSGLVGQIQAVNQAFLRHFDDAREQARDRLQKHDVPARSEIWTMLNLAASTALAAAGGGIASALLSPLLESAERVAVASVLKKAISSAFHFDLAPTPRDPANLVRSYLDEVQHQASTRTDRLAATWSATHDALQSLPTAALELFAQNVTTVLEDEAYTTVALRHILVGWTNFLARARHGAMQWDPWQSGGGAGAIKLDGARDPWAEPASTRSDPTTGNVDPKAMSWALARTQRPMMSEHYGILEIFLDSSGRIVDLPDYGMRLDNVGPDVRKEFQKMPRVRDLAVNKIVRLCAYRHDGVDVDPPVPIASVLITADGFVRAHDWARFMRVHVEESAPRKPWDIKGDFGRCMDQLIEGRETKSCHIDHASENADVAAFAERAQNLPLSYLKV